MSFFTLPRELRDDIYHLLWLEASVTTLNQRYDIAQGTWYNEYKTFSPKIFKKDNFNGLPSWLKTSKAMESEGMEAFIRRGSLRIVVFQTTRQARISANGLWHSEFLHRVPIGTLLPHARNIELTLPLLKFRRTYGLNLHIACKKCCMGALVQYLRAAKSLKSLKITLDMRSETFLDRNITITLGALKDFWNNGVELNKFEISVQGSFMYPAGVITFEEALGRNFNRLASDIPAHREQKLEFIDDELKWTFIYTRETGPEGR